MSDRLILAFDTSAAHCAAALLKGDSLLGTRHQQMARGQAEHLMPMLEELLDNCGHCYGDLDAIAVGTGPGNFTGLRIAVAAARGLALALDRPAIGVTGFEAVWWLASQPVVACLPAPRDAFYVRAPGTDPLLVEADRLGDMDLPEDMQLAGPAAKAVARALQRPIDHTNAPSAEAIAHVAAKQANVPSVRPAPLYVQPADAAPPRDPGPLILP